MDRPETADNSTRNRALLTFALIATVVGGWLYATRTAVDAEAARVAPAPAVAEGFRADLLALPNDSMLGFVEIPGGPFLMGSDPQVDRAAFENEQWGGEAGQETVDLPTYYIGRYEVTIGQFVEFVRATDRPVPDTMAIRGPPNYPVSSISWPDAVAYGRWLERELLASPQTPDSLRSLLEGGWRITLPTEAQWEKAARGTDGRIFPWGNEPVRGRANFGAAARVPVGSFNCPECANGLADMSGHVWELTRTPYGPVPVADADPAADLAADALWVMRGGAYNDPANLVRAAVRGGTDPGARRPFIGFRLAIIPPE